MRIITLLVARWQAARARRVAERELAALFRASWVTWASRGLA